MEKPLTRPAWLSYDRIAFGSCLAVAVIFFVQAYRLEMWTIVGPGPGLFPSIAAGVCAVLALLLLLFPVLGDDRTTAAPEQEGNPLPSEAEAEDPPMTAKERVVFWTYIVVLPFLVVGSAYLGFLALSVAIALILTWWAEGRDWRAALAFGLGCGVVGDVVFNRYLSTSVPITELDQMLLRLFQ